MAGAGHPDRPTTIDPFDPVALAMRLAEARDRRAAALANRKPISATEALGGDRRPAVRRPAFGPHSIGVGPPASNPAPGPQKPGPFHHFGEQYPARLEPTIRAEAPLSHAPLPRPAGGTLPPVERPLSAVARRSRVLLPVAVVFVGVVALGSALLLAPSGLRRDIAELISPGLRPSPQGDVPAGEALDPVVSPVRRPPAAESLASGDTRLPAASAAAQYPSFAVTFTENLSSAGYASPRPPTKDASPALEALLEPLASVAIPITPGALAPPRAVPGLPVAVTPDAGVAPRMTSSRGVPGRPDADQTPEAPPLVEAGLPTGAIAGSQTGRAEDVRVAIGFPGAKPESEHASVRLSRAGFGRPEAVLGALSPGESRVRFALQADVPAPPQHRLALS